MAQMLVHIFNLAFIDALFHAFVGRGIIRHPAFYSANCRQFLFNFRTNRSATPDIDTAAYKNNSIRCKVYQDIQGQLRREFGVNRYEYIKRCQLSQAINIIQEYTVPIILQDEITLLNNQVSF